MKRYSIRSIDWSKENKRLKEIQTQFAEDPQGEWVKYEDVKEIIEKIEYVRESMNEGFMETCHDIIEFDLNKDGFTTKVEYPIQNE